MGLDLRMPIGLMFLIMGLLLLGYGLLADRAIYARSLGINVNLIWGAVLIVFSLVMIGLARLAARRRREAGAEPPAATDPRGPGDERGA